MWDRHSLVSCFVWILSLLATLSHYSFQSFSDTALTIICLSSSMIALAPFPSLSSISYSSPISTSSIISSPSSIFWSVSSGFPSSRSLTYSYFGFLKLKFFLFNAFEANWSKIETTCSPQPALSLRGGKSHWIPTFLHSLIIVVDTVMGSSNFENSEDEISLIWKSHLIKLAINEKILFEIVELLSGIGGKWKWGWGDSFIPPWFNKIITFERSLFNTGEVSAYQANLRWARWRLHQLLRVP